MSTVVTTIVTLATLILSVAGVVYARKQLHHSRQSRAAPPPTFGLARSSDGRYRVTAKNGGDAVVRHIHAWLVDPESSLDLTDRGREIGSLVAGEKVVAWLDIRDSRDSVPGSTPAKDPQLWFSWEPEKGRTRLDPECSHARVQDLSREASGWADAGERERWSVAFVFDRSARRFHWGSGHQQILYRDQALRELFEQGENGAKTLVQGRVASDWQVEIYDGDDDDLEREEIGRAAVAAAPRDEAGGLARIRQEALTLE